MVHGIDTDIVKIERIANTYNRFGQRFLKRIYCDSELLEFEQRNKSITFLASRFSAKEAFAKALGTGIRGGVSMQEICITNDDMGKPLISCVGKTKDVIDRLGIGDIHISMSDEIEYAISYIVMMKS